MLSTGTLLSLLFLLLGGAKTIGEFDIGSANMEFADGDMTAPGIDTSPKCTAAMMRMNSETKQVPGNEFEKSRKRQHHVNHLFMSSRIQSKK